MYEDNRTWRLQRDLVMVLALNICEDCGEEARVFIIRTEQSLTIVYITLKHCAIAVIENIILLNSNVAEEK